MPGGVPGLVYASGLDVGVPLYEDDVGTHFTIGGPPQGDGTLHLRRQIPDGPVIETGLIQGGGLGFPSLPNPNLPPGIYRLFFRFRAVCELCAWGDFQYDTYEGHSTDQTPGTAFLLSAAGLHIDHTIMPGWIFHPNTRDDWVNGSLTTSAAGPFRDYLFAPSGLLNGHQEARDMSKGCFYIDRICEWSCTSPRSVFNVSATAGLFLLAIRSEFYVGGTSDAEFLIASSPTVPNPDVGIRIRLNQFGSCAYYQNSAQFNPARLFDGTPMFGAVGAPPKTSQVGECQFLGARSEPALRPEKVTDLTAPLLLTDFGF